jgi:hypothetical protein
MRLRTIGVVAVVAAVLVLVVSLIAGLRSDVPAPAVTPAQPRVDGERLRVEVLNGAGIAGLAREATRLLRDRNFDVVYFGNAGGEPRDSSVVIDRVGRPQEAANVARALGIPRVESQPDTTLYLEATVILGKDWSAAGAAQF